MKVEELKNSLGRTVVSTWDERLRIIEVKDTYIVVDAPERRTYYTDGKLTPMPMKKIYFKTTNQVWNTNSLLSFDDNYEFKMKVFKMGVLLVKPENVQPNTVPSIEESKKLKPPVIRRSKETLAREKAMKDYTKRMLNR